MRNFIWGFLLIGFGFLILLDNLGYADFSEVVHDYWPLLLILWGVSILIKRNREQAAAAAQAGMAPPPQSAHGTPPPPPAGTVPPPPGQTYSAGVTTDLIHDSNVFGDVHTKITSRQFKGGSVSTVFGNSIVDLSSADVATGDHELRISGVFGNCTVILSQGMAASISASTLFGDVVNLDRARSGISSEVLATTPSFMTSTNRLKITIHGVFGRVHVS
jgi:hypothetical protein